MSPGTVKPNTPSKVGQAGLPSVPPSSQSILLEKVNARTSTPDSEVLASSDEEADGRIPEPTHPVAPPYKPVRRASWLNDTSQPIPRPRKSSFASGTMSPTASHPGTPSADAASGGLWGSHSASTAMLGRGQGSSFPWGTGIWNNSERKDTSRFGDVLASPTSALPPGTTANSILGPEPGLAQQSSGPRDQSSNPPFPFAIPLHPTPKTSRSQSYSVGQMDTDAIPPSMSASTILGRARPPHSMLQHRPSRPSMLSEMSSEGGLGKVKEVEDDQEEDGESPSGSHLHNSFHQSAEAKIEILTRENAMLRQQQQQQYQSSRIRPRSSTAAAYGLGGGYALQESVPEESEFAVDELDESHEVGDFGPIRRTLNRRMSEFGPSAFRSPFGVDNRKLESGKKNIWHSQLGFGGQGDMPQSRRHSFADVPTRQASISSLGGDPGVGVDMSLLDAQAAQDYPPYAESSNFSMTGTAAGAHYAGMGPGIASSLPIGQSGFSGAYSSPYSVHGQFANRAPSPHRSVYGMTQPRHNQLLHIVYFKCSRADVFYIQEGTGLTVKPGDLVIVEADRGTDIGTVVRDNVDWQMAKELKEYYNEEHYKWLMMYSQNAAAVQEGTGLVSSPNAFQASAVGGMGPPSHHHMQDSNAGELKPKLIKRLAQSHEIHALREKEGNEAKAKRVCMQKVKEHGLNMEILDAEFQMDWKKLTFYYFADSYINFNSLVTDLFKIYKTRIWMSAVNPASFANPTLGIQAPSGIGPGAVGPGAVGGGRGGGQHPERRANQTQQEQQAAPQTNRGYQGAAFGQNFSSGERGVAQAAPSYASENFGYQPQYGLGFGAALRPGNNGSYHAASGQSADGFGGGFSHQNDFSSVRRAQGNMPGAGHHAQSVSPVGAQQEWASAFQGLSLNSR